MIEKVLIYEVHYSNFNRYVIPLANYLIENSISKEVLMICDRFTNQERINTDRNDNIGLSLAEEELETLKGKNISNVVFLNYSYRITDIYWTSQFKKLGIYCMQMQHGMYAEFLERSFLGYFSAIGRKYTYLKYLCSFLLNGELVIFLYLFNKDFIKSFKINNYLERKKNKISPVQSNQVLIWGDYWKEWFVKNHFYKESDNFITVGNPDYHTFIKNSPANKQTYKVCYIAQTFVEDGRMEFSDYKAIIDELSDAIGAKLIVKLHPRSDKAIFEKVLKNKGEITYDFPLTGFYIGHYSSLLALAANEDSKVFLLEINDEEIPYYFKNSADGIYAEMKDLISAIQISEKNYSKKEISYYFENKETHPFEIIGQVMKGKS